MMFTKPRLLFACQTLANLILILLSSYVLVVFFTKDTKLLLTSEIYTANTTPFNPIFHFKLCSIRDKRYFLKDKQKESEKKETFLYFKHYQIIRHLFCEY